MDANEVILADTCVVIWLAESRSGTPLSRRAIEAIEVARSEDGIAISDVTLYELAWLVANKRIPISMSIDTFLKEVESRFVVLPVTSGVAKLAMELPASYPKDPMDRIIGATALDRGMPLVTRDRGIRNSKAVPVIW